MPFLLNAPYVAVKSPRNMPIFGVIPVVGGIVAVISKNWEIRYAASKTPKPLPNTPIIKDTEKVKVQDWLTPAQLSSTKAYIDRRYKLERQGPLGVPEHFELAGLARKAMTELSVGTFRDGKPKDNGWQTLMRAGKHSSFKSCHASHLDWKKHLASQPAVPPPVELDTGGPETPEQLGFGI